jgi:GTP-binding protein HflX
VLVFNKIDLVTSANVPADENREAALDGSTPQSTAASFQPRLDWVDGGKTPRAWVSAVTGAGLDGLRTAIASRLGAERIRAELHVPSASGRLRARLHAQGLVADESADDSGWHIRIDAPRALVEPLFGLPDGDGDWLRGRLLAG